MNNFGTADMVSPLRRVLVKKPTAAMADADPKIWHYSAPLSQDLLDRDHAALIAILENYGAEVLYLEQDSLELADAVFTHDVSLVTPHGAVICRMGKTLRRGEQEWHQNFYTQQQVPILGTIESPGTARSGRLRLARCKDASGRTGFSYQSVGYGSIAGNTRPARSRHPQLRSAGLSRRVRLPASDVDPEHAGS